MTSIVSRTRNYPRWSDNSRIRRTYKSYQKCHSLWARQIALKNSTDTNERSIDYLDGITHSQRFLRQFYDPVCGTSFNFSNYAFVHF
jgi:hypothetical protein